MKNLFSLYLILGGLMVSTSAHAIVDMKNANYANTWVDIEVPGPASGYELKIARTYNSRSLLNGIFGFGWCSDFETKLDKTAEGNLKLVECGAGQETYFMPRESGRKEIDQTISLITNKLREQQKMGAGEIKQLAAKMVSDNDLRAQYAADMKISIAIKPGTKFFANGREVENIVWDKGYYTRTMADGASMRFSNDGHLTHLYDKNGNYLKFDYDKDTIREVVDNNGRRLSFKFYTNKKVKSIVGPNGISADYKYANMDDLASAKNGWGNTYNYEYDDLHNMTKATYPDKTFISLGYDKKNDWVTSFTDRQKCTETYKYEFSESEPKLHYWATVKKVCGKDVVNDSKHEFWFKNRSDGQVYMQRVASTVNGVITDITYHDTFGKPLSIRRNNDVATFEYFANGQVRRKITPMAIFTYDYDAKNRKVANVSVQYMNEKGKALQTKKTTFQYDGKGNLTYAANSDGQKIQMTYDPKGRIATIVDQAKKVVKIQYEDRFGKPALVNRPGLGTIQVSYKANGDIDKVSSKEGPTVAMQVASTFNNLLDIISPATAEVYN